MLQSHLDILLLRHNKFIMRCKRQTLLVLSFIFASFLFFQCFCEDFQKYHYDLFDEGISDKLWFLPHETAFLTPRSSSSRPVAIVSTTKIIPETASAVIKERTISVEMTPRRRSFPFLKALVKAKQNKNRIPDVLDAASETSGPTSRISRRPKIKYEKVSRVVPLDNLVFESMADPQSFEEEDVGLHITNPPMAASTLYPLERRPARKPRLFLIKVLSKIFGSVNFTVVSRLPCSQSSFLGI